MVTPDNHFAVPRLADIYDELDSDRSDLDLYVAMVAEFGARSVLDVGCGTGSLAVRLAAEGVDVVGIDPATASLAVAARKRGADAVRWIHGDSTSLKSPAFADPAVVDMAVMTANVAQVFLDDAGWHTTLSDVGAVVRPAGALVFETRVPERRTWERWTPENSRKTVRTRLHGAVEHWVEVTDVSLPFVSFRHTYRFADDGATLTSDSTLRFRSLDEIEASLAATGWSVSEVRDAPDRPGLEHVIVARRT